MSQHSDLDMFLEKVMHISVLRMGGAAAGIIGSSGADVGIVNSLKKTTLDFANECRKPTPNQAELQRLSNEVGGFLHTLGVLSILSAEETTNLIQQLQKLTDTD